MDESYFNGTFPIGYFLDNKPLQIFYKTLTPFLYLVPNTVFRISNDNPRC